MLFDFVFFRKTKYTLLEALGVSFFYTSIAIFLSYIAFKEYASLLSVFLTTFALIPFVYSRFKHDEFLGMKINSNKRILRVHTHTLLLFMFMFLGITFAYMTWYVFLDFQIRPLMFEAQANIVSKINGNVTGSYTNPVLFMKIFSNNIKVLAFVALFGLLYGFGGLYILAWNASVLGYALGNYFLKFLSEGVHFAIMKAILRYFTHGLLEILAYFIAALATGIMFIAIVRKDFRDNNFDKILRDVSELFIMSIFVLVIAAFIEVYVTPFFY